MPASWQNYARIPVSFPDGLSQTLVFVEKQSICNYGGSLWGAVDLDLWQPHFAAWSMDPPQVQPRREECDPVRPQTPFTSGITVALGDGSVRVVSRVISAATWWAACTPDGSDFLGNDW